MDDSSPASWRTEVLPFVIELQTAHSVRQAVDGEWLLLTSRSFDRTGIFRPERRRLRVTPSFFDELSDEALLLKTSADGEQPVGTIVSPVERLNLGPTCCGPSWTLLVPDDYLRGDFLALVMGAELVRDLIERHLQQKTLDMELLFQIQVPLPPLAVQARIVAQVWPLDEAIRLNREVIGRLLRLRPLLRHRLDAEGAIGENERVVALLVACRQRLFDRLLAQAASV